MYTCLGIYVNSGHARAPRMCLFFLKKGEITIKSSNSNLHQVYFDLLVILDIEV
jgi:hypothetical protein